MEKVDILSALAEVALKREDVETSLNDYLKALSMLERLAEPVSRHIGNSCRRKESFYDLQLDVKGCRDVYASFDKYVEVERLEGDNKYQAEEHGLQMARYFF
ncbi:hypothetical protein L2E82_22412 [Cichorium intybus]|uniref:Uncharacterized protein n=1 Tax=Cichorium intybus TaxID=13427 RepID=A0ACB9DXX6_CICIN|nr:hypothetical protein L2E82_22412 [Cichorium intybus]